MKGITVITVITIVAMMNETVTVIAKMTLVRTNVPATVMA